MVPVAMTTASLMEEVGLATLAEAPVTMEGGVAEVARSTAARTRWQVCTVEPVTGVL